MANQYQENERLQRLIDTIVKRIDELETKILAAIEDKTTTKKKGE